MLYNSINYIAKYLKDLDDKQSKPLFDHIAKLIINTGKLKPLRKSLTVKNRAGIYLLYNKSKTIIYIGESGNLKKRYSDLWKTRNHAFRRAFGNDLLSIRYTTFKPIHSSKERFNTINENILNGEMSNLYILIIYISFGRKEIEEYLIQREKYKARNMQYKLYNIKERRK